MYSKRLTRIGLNVFILCALLAGMVVLSPPQLVLADSSESGFHISQWNGGTWEEVYQHPFQVQYSTEALTVNVVDGKVVLRIVQVGTPFADIDQILLTVDGEELVPEYARYTGNSLSILEDILELDHNVVLAHEQEIEVSWDVPTAYDHVTVYLTANEYNDNIGEPLHFPQTGYATYKMGSNIGTKNVDGMINETDGTTPLYSPFWHPVTGHPDGYTYIYVCDDEQYVYFSLDITSDNTNEYGEDWAEIRILQSDGSEKAFRINDFDNTWGKSGFGLTSKVSYKHQTYEFAIPKSIIGSEDVEFDLTYYGTEVGPYTLVVEASNGTVDKNPDYPYYEYNTVVELTATADTGYHFVNWTGDFIGSPNNSNPMYVTMDGSRTITANFEIDTFTLTYDTDGNGDISGTTPQTVDYGYNGSAVTAEPDTGYHFVDWSDSSTDNPRTDMNVTGDITVTANFAIDTFNLEYYAGDNGSIAGETGQTVDYMGSGEAVTAIPDEGYHFVDWSDGSEDNPRTDLYVTADISVTASFDIDSYTLTYDTDGNGYISGETPQTVDYGSDGSAVTAEPDDGYYFVDWSDESIANPRTDTNVTADITVTANFAINPYAVTYYANGGSGDAPTEPNKVAGEEFEIAYRTFDPPTVNQQFKEWNTTADGSGTSYAEYANVTMPAYNLDLYAIWEDIIYTVAFDSAGGSAVASQGVVSGDKSTQPADPTRTGYSFGGWYTDAGTWSNQWDFANGVVSEDITLCAKWTLVWSGYESYMTGPDYDYMVLGYGNGTAAAAQSFTAESSHLVSGVILRLWRDPGYSGTLTVSIRATTASGVPTGPDLCSGTLNSSDIEPSQYWNSWYVIPMTPTLPLANGSTYAIVARATASHDYNEIHWVAVDGGGTYAGGQFWNSANSGSSWVSHGSGVDCFFGIQGDTSYTVSFDSNGGSAVASQGIPSGGRATEPDDPVLTDYTFDGWFTDETWATQWDFSTVITGDITLYAQWTRNLQAPVITSANSTTFTAGTNRSFTVTTTGWPTPAITETSGSLPAGLNFADNGNGTATLSGTPAAGTAGLYNLQFSATNSAGTNTQSFTLTVRNAPTITTQPSNYAVVVGETASFTIVATGYPAPTFQWQLSTREGRWSDIPGATGSTYATPAATGRMSGYQYQVIVSNAAGSVTSNAATLTVYKTGPVVWADVSIAKEGSYDSGNKTITWTITVTNHGPGAAQGVMVKDTLISGTTFTGIEVSGATTKVGGRTVTVNIGTLASGNSCTIKIYALVTRTTAPFANTATVTTTSYDSHPEDNVATDTMP